MIYDEDLYAICAEESDVAARYELLDVRVSSSLKGGPRADVTAGATRSIAARLLAHVAHTDIIVASAKAYINALNKLEWRKAQRSSQRTQEKGP